MEGPIQDRYVLTSRRSQIYRMFVKCINCVTIFTVKYINCVTIFTVKCLHKTNIRGGEPLRMLIMSIVGGMVIEWDV